MKWLFLIILAVACTQSKPACTQSALEVLTVSCEEAILSAKNETDAKLIAAACLKAIDEWESCK